MASPYPEFTPPPEISTGSPRDWTEAQANRYLVWLVTSLDRRVTDMLHFVGESDDDDCPSLLRRVGEKAVWILRKPGFLLQGEHAEARFSEAGYALAADIGLLVARCLIRKHDKVRWEILRRNKNDPSYRQPILVGFGQQHLDPVRGSVAEAGRILRGESPVDAWLRILEYWSERARLDSGPVSGRTTST